MLDSWRHNGQNASLRAWGRGIEKIVRKLTLNPGPKFEIAPGTFHWRRFGYKLLKNASKPALTGAGADGGPARLKAMYALRRQHWITPANLKDRSGFIVGAVQTLDEQIPKRIEEAKAATGNIRDQLLTLVECMMLWPDLFLLHRKDDRLAVEQWKTKAGRAALQGKTDGRLEIYEDDCRLYKKLRSDLIKIRTCSVELELAPAAEPVPAWLANGHTPPAANIYLLGLDGVEKNDFLRIIPEELGIPGESLTVPPMLKAERKRHRGHLAGRA